MEERNPTTLIKWKNTEVYRKVHDHIRGKYEGISDFCQLAAVEKLSSDRGTSIEDFFKLINDETNRRLQEKKKTQNWAMMLTSLTLILGLVIGGSISYYMGYSKLKNQNIYKDDVLRFITNCESMQGEIFNNGEDFIGCQMVNQSRNIIKMNVFCKIHNLEVYQDNSLIKCGGR